MFAVEFVFPSYESEIGKEKDRKDDAIFSLEIGLIKKYLYRQSDKTYFDKMGE
jgi:hypothetical protein